MDIRLVQDFAKPCGDQIFDAHAADRRGFLIQGQSRERLKVRLIRQDGDGWMNLHGVEPMRKDQARLR